MCVGGGGRVRVKLLYQWEKFGYKVGGGAGGGSKGKTTISIGEVRL